jgi:hypothetical protein
MYLQPPCQRLHDRLTLFPGFIRGGTGFCVEIDTSRFLHHLRMQAVGYLYGQLDETEALRQEAVVRLSVVVVWNGLVLRNQLMGYIINRACLSASFPGRMIE